MSTHDTPCALSRCCCRRCLWKLGSFLRRSTRWANVPCALGPAAVKTTKGKSKSKTVVVRIGSILSS